MQVALVFNLNSNDVFSLDHVELGTISVSYFRHVSICEPVYNRRIVIFFRNDFICLTESGDCKLSNGLIITV